MGVYGLTTRPAYDRALYSSTTGRVAPTLPIFSTATSSATRWSSSHARTCAARGALFGCHQAGLCPALTFDAPRSVERRNSTSSPSQIACQPWWRTCAHVAAPLAQEGPGDRRLGAEYGDRHRPLTGRQVVRPLRDDVVAVQTLVLQMSGPWSQFGFTLDEVRGQPLPAVCRGKQRLAVSPVCVR